MIHRRLRVRQRDAIMPGVRIYRDRVIAARNDLERQTRVDLHIDRQLVVFGRRDLGRRNQGSVSYPVGVG